MLDAAVTGQVPRRARTPVRPAATAPVGPSARRDLGEDFAPRRSSLGPVGEMVQDEEDYVPARRFGGLRFRLRAGIPRSIVGRVLAGCAVLAALGGTILAMWELRGMVLHNPRLVLESSSAIQITGNSHLTRAQLLTVFGEDVDRNILTVSLAERRAELERLPWVEHATVMRLLPDHFRVAIVERKPVAFVRQGSAIGMVDRNGVLLDMVSDGDAPVETHYSFPVVSGISAQDPLSQRAARMKLYMRFMAELGEQSQHLSEVDLSSPEDVKALIPDGGSDILVHFGDTDFLRRYELYEKNLPGWKKEFPKLASADMRYERQVVLEMQPGVAVPVQGTGADESGEAKTPAPVKSAAKAKGKSSSTPTPSTKPIEMGHPTGGTGPVGGGHLQNSFDVHTKKGDTAAKTTTQAGPQ